MLVNKMSLPEKSTKGRSALSEVLPQVTRRLPVRIAGFEPLAATLPRTARPGCGLEDCHRLGVPEYASAIIEENRRGRVLAKCVVNVQRGRIGATRDGIDPKSSERRFDRRAFAPTGRAHDDERVEIGAFHESFDESLNRSDVFHISPRALISHGGGGKTSLGQAMCKLHFYEFVRSVRKRRCSIAEMTSTLTETQSHAL